MSIACNIKKMNETKQLKREYINRDATGSINEEFVIAENVVPGAVVLLTEIVVFSQLDIGFGCIYWLAIYSVFIRTKITIETLIYIRLWALIIGLNY